MQAVSRLGGVLAVLLITAPGLAAAQGNGPARPGYRQAEDGAPTGMTGHFRGWESQQGSGSGANNFVGNGRGHPGGNRSAGHFGGWFANNHSGGGRD